MERTSKSLTKTSTSSMKLQGGALFNISKPTKVWLKVQALSMNVVEKDLP